MATSTKPTFKLGQMVEWTSQANGNVRTKIGVVIRVLPAHFPFQWLNEHYKTKSRGDRDHETYLICVPSPEGAEFFRPYVHQLKAANRYLPLVLARKSEKNVKAFAPPK